MRVIAGEAKGRRLVTPPGAATRSATDRVRESLFGILEPRIEGARVLDLFAGAGTLGIEALSRGAEHATFVERSPAALAAIRTNLEATGLRDRARVVRSDVLAFVTGADPYGPYDLAFCDPPFADVEVLEETLARLGSRVVLARGAVVVARAMRKYPPAVPAGAWIERTKGIGEEMLLFVRYDAVAQRGR